MSTTPSGMICWYTSVVVDVSVLHPKAAKFSGPKPGIRQDLDQGAGEVQSRIGVGGGDNAIDLLDREGWWWRAANANTLGTTRRCHDESSYSLRFRLSLGIGTSDRTALVPTQVGCKTKFRQ